MRKFKSVGNSSYRLKYVDGYFEIYSKNTYFVVSRSEQPPRFFVRDRIAGYHLRTVAAADLAVGLLEDRSFASMLYHCLMRRLKTVLFVIFAYALASSYTIS